MNIRAEDMSRILREQVGGYTVDVDVAEVGTVVTIGDGMARLHGVERCMAGEMIVFPGGAFGIALNLEEDSVGSVLLGDAHHVKEGDVVKRTGRIISVPVGDETLGRVVNALGQPVDGRAWCRPPSSCRSAHRARRRRSPVGARAAADRPQATDAMIPTAAASASRSSATARPARPRSPSTPS